MVRNPQPLSTFDVWLRCMYCPQGVGLYISWYCLNAISNQVLAFQAVSWCWVNIMRALVCSCHQISNCCCRFKYRYLLSIIHKISTTSARLWNVLLPMARRVMKEPNQVVAGNRYHFWWCLKRLWFVRSSQLQMSLSQFQRPAIKRFFPMALRTKWGAR